jgi:hypothetical protein
MAQKVVSVPHELANVFKSSQYQIQQPYIQITEEGYNIASTTDNSETYRAVRPRKLMRSFFAALIGVLGFMVTYFVFISLGLVVGKALAGDNEQMMGTVTGIFVLVGLAVGMVGFVLTSKSIAPKRRATVFKNDQPILHIDPTSGFFLLNHEYHVKDTAGIPVLTFSKSVLKSLFQIKWHCHDSSGEYLFTAIEDSITFAFMRRYLGLGRLIPLHFNFMRAGGKPFGQFIRRFSLRDKYKLNYQPAAIDGWLMVASAILLDTGENR